MIDVLEDLEITERLPGVTLDNTSSNSSMLAEFEKYMSEKYPGTGFSQAWNQVDCMYGPCAKSWGTGNINSSGGDIVEKTQFLKFNL